MAKIKGPLMSLSAAGSVGIATFSATQVGHGQPHIARKKPKGRTSDRSPSQVRGNIRFKEATAAWKLLDDETRNHWENLATQLGREARTVYIQETMRQHINAPDLPKVPTAFIPE